MTMQNDNRNNANFGLSNHRISSQDIDHAIRKLQDAYADGRLDETELDERMEIALKAKTGSDLTSLFRDLPTIVTNAHLHSSPPFSRVKSQSIAIFSGIEQTGHFILPNIYRVVAVMGGCVIDLSQAKFTSHETTMKITAVMGGVQILVPCGIRVQVDGLPIMGGIAKNLKPDHLPTDAPILHIHCVTVMGGIEVKTKA